MSQGPRTRSRYALWVVMAVVAAACSATVTVSVRDRDGVSVYPADWPCRNGRPDEAGVLYPASDVYADTRLISWPTASPEEVGLDGDLLEQGATEIARAPRVNSLLIARHGRLVFERYFNGAEASDARNPHSATKSLIGLLVGIAIEDGYLPGLDIPIGDLIPDVVTGSEVSRVTVGDLLSMSAGLEWNDDESPYQGTSMIDALIHAERVAEPGAVFEYNSGLSDLLALAMNRLVPGGLCRYAHARLFTPLGIDVDHWHENPEGSVTGGNSAFLTPRELARVGQLVLDDGSWRGRQLVPRDWLDTMLEPRFELPTPNLRRAGLVVSYGLHWWINDLDGVRIWNASGYGGQDIRVIPSLDMVVVVTHDTSGLVDRQVPSPDFMHLFVLQAAGDTINECPCPPDFFRAHPDGSGRQALAQHPANDLAGDWSPDGTQIAFHSFRDLNAELYVMNADGTGLRRLTYDWALEGGPKWSPDGTRLGFISDRGNADLLDFPVIDLYVIDLASEQIEQLTGMGDVRWLDWAPFDDRIVFVRGGLNALGDLWVTDLATGSTEMLLAGPVGFPAWSPDGSAIAVEVSEEAGGTSRIAILDLASGTLTDLGPGGIPAWSGDGSQVFATIDGATLVAYDISDGTRTDIGAMPYGVPSPDGEWILFTDTPE